MPLNLNVVPGLQADTDDDGNITVALTLDNPAFDQMNTTLGAILAELKNIRRIMADQAGPIAHGIEGVDPSTTVTSPDGTLN